MLNFKKALPVAIIAASAMLCSSPSFAYQSATTEVNVTIDTRDLETDAGIERVWFQLSRKAKHSCDAVGVNNLREKRAESDCINSLLNSFIDDVDHTELRAYHLAHHDQ